MSDELSYYKHLAEHVMFKTRGCRFTAAIALRTKDKWSIGTASFLAIYLLAWSVASLAYPEIFTANHTRFYTAVSAIASASLLVISLLDFAFDRSGQAEKLNRNALAISALMRRLERELQAQQPNVAVLREVAAKYEEHIAETQINHTDMDLRRWEYGRATSTNFLISPLLHLRRHAYNAWYYLSSMLMYPIVILSVVVPTVWYSIAVVLPSLHH